MTIQITVRLPDDLVDFVDHQVTAGQVRSRAEAISRALRQARRQAIAEHDAAVYAAELGAEDPDDLHGLATWAAGQTLSID